VPTPNWKRNRSRHGQADTHSSDSSNSDVTVSTNSSENVLQNWTQYRTAYLNVPSLSTIDCAILVLRSVQNCRPLCRKKQEELYHFQQSFYYGHTTKRRAKWDRWVIMRMRTMLLPSIIPVTQTCLESPFHSLTKCASKWRYSEYSIV
jgi:hypothetical protein